MPATMRDKPGGCKVYAYLFIRLSLPDVPADKFFFHVGACDGMVWMRLVMDK
jgi:hypothetical protein